MNEAVIICGLVGIGSIVTILVAGFVLGLVITKVDGSKETSRHH